MPRIEYLGFFLYNKEDMKKVIVSLIISAITVLMLVAFIAYLVYQGIYIEMYKYGNSFPSWALFIPAALLGIILAPYIVCLINHFKSIKLIKLNNRAITRNLVSPILIGYFLVCASVVIDVVYLLFDAIFTKRFIAFVEDPAFSFATLGIAHLFYVIPIVMIIVLAHEKKKA